VQALRGHADSVNEVQWLSYSNTLATASSDKTVSLWDARTGLSCATFYNHANSVNSVCASLDGRTLVSCDADGTIKVWDVRTVSARGSVALAAYGLNRVRLDRSGGVAFACCDDGHVYAVGLAEMAKLSELKGHDDAVQSVALDPNGEFLVTSSSDCTFKLWTTVQ
jgi:sperm-associated antigen 16 protein